MGFQDEALRPTQASFSTIFLKICGRGESLWTATRLKTEVGVSKSMLPVKYFCSTEPLFVPFKFHGDHKTATKMRQIWLHSVLGILPD